MDWLYVQLLDVPRALAVRGWFTDGELVLDVDDPFLGGTAPSTLVRAGHIRAHHPGAATLADALFRTDRPPHCLHWF